MQCWSKKPVEDYHAQNNYIYLSSFKDTQNYTYIA